MAYLNITNDLNSRGRKLPVGKVLIWDYEGSPIYMKIMKKQDGQIFAKKLDPRLFLTPEEADEQIVVTENQLADTITIVNKLHKK